MRTLNETIKTQLLSYWFAKLKFFFIFLMSLGFKCDWKTIKIKTQVKENLRAERKTIQIDSQILLFKSNRPAKFFEFEKLRLLRLSWLLNLLVSSNVQYTAQVVLLVESKKYNLHKSIASSLSKFPPSTHRGRIICVQMNSLPWRRFI